MRRIPSLCWCAAIAAAIAFQAQPATAADLYAAPGQIVEADGARLNVTCIGSDSPTIVFDAGHQDWSPAWAVVQPEVARWARACSFDRPGYGFSPPGPGPRSSERIARELHDALHALGMNGPYLLVGHAFGGYNMRAFAYGYLPEVEGLVLIDTDAGDTAPAERIAAMHDVFIRQAVEIQRCVDAVAAADPAVPAARSPGPPELRCDGRFFRGFPEPNWPARLNEALLQRVRSDPGLYQAAIDELQEMPGDEFWLRAHRRSLGARPVRVITAAQHFSDTQATAPDERARHERANRLMNDAQARLLALSSNARQVFATRSRAAYVQFDEPELVLAAIREVALADRPAARQFPRERAGR
jgi:pimeloyl-ACP methyl ester carboxylesterase